MECYTMRREEINFNIYRRIQGDINLHPKMAKRGSTPLQVRYSSGATLTTGNITIQANQVPSEGFKLPFDTTALLGAVSGVVIMMVALVLWRVATERTPSTVTE